MIDDMADILVKQQILPQEIFDKALKLLGMEKLIEVATDVGYYISAAFVINTYAIPVRGAYRTWRE